MSEPSPSTSSGAGKPVHEPTSKLLLTPSPEIAKPKKGDKIYLMDEIPSNPWLDAKVVEEKWNDFLEQNVYCVEGQPKGKKRRKTSFELILEEMADSIPCPHTLPVGFRVVARRFESAPDGSLASPGNLFLGVVGESANPTTNKSRYLIFFDNGYAQYVEPCQVFVVYEPKNLVWVEDNPRNYKFIKEYVKKYPNWPLANLNAKSLVHVELKGKWHLVRVLEEDYSMVKVQFQIDEHIEWIFRGSKRFQRPTFNDSNREDAPAAGLRLDYEGSVEQVQIPGNVPQPRVFTPHKCTHECVISFLPSTQLYKLSPLVIPLFLGWLRKVDGSSVSYLTPCGLELKEYGRLSKCLEDTSCNIPLNFFYFGTDVNVLDVFVPKHVALKLEDFSEGKEARPIQLVTSNANDPMPAFEYIVESIVVVDDHSSDVVATPMGCDCIDNCSVSCKCNKAIGTTRKTKTYENMRLRSYPQQGFYECGNKCSCNETCANRVVQGGVKWPLQIFKTGNKGWGVRALHDIPEGTFLCPYPGEIFTDKALDEQRDDSTYYASLLKGKKGRGAYSVDAKFKGNVGRFINHSCDPSVNFQKVFVNSEGARFPTHAFFTACVIKAGWELTMDYNYAINKSNSENAVYCACESPNCRKRFL